MTNSHDGPVAGARKSDLIELAEERARRADAALVEAEEEVAQAETALAADTAGDPDS